MQPALDIVEAIAAHNDARVKPATMFADLKGQNFARLSDADLDSEACPCLIHIVNGFFHGHDDIMPDVAGHRNLGWQIPESPSDTGNCAWAHIWLAVWQTKLAREIEMVVFRIHRPDGFIQCPHQIIGQTVHRPEIRARLRRQVGL